MSTLNEADTRAKLIDPKVKASGWGESHIEREHFFRKGKPFTDGRIYLVGKEARRKEPKRVDYLFRYRGLPIAVLEAKEEKKSVGAGLEQAKDYASALDVPFCYSSNGHGFIEYDFLTHKSKELENFPRPQALWERWQGEPPSEVAFMRKAAEPPILKWPEQNPLLHPYCQPEKCGNISPRYFQEAAIRRVMERAVAGQKRILLTMATGTGKTFIAFQIAWKLIKSGWFKEQHPERPGRILFLVDRVILRSQAFNMFSAFADSASDPRMIIKGEPLKLTRDLYFGIYQTLWAEDVHEKRLFEKFPKDFFDFIIIDECHRSGFGTWREILDHFEGAIHMGMTATPKKEENIDTYAYFCEEEEEVWIDPEDPEKGKWKPPAYQYSLGQGIEDGFLATYRVHRVRTTVDAKGLNLQDAADEGAEVFVPDGIEPKDIYHTPQFEREVTLPDRTEVIVKHLSKLLRRNGSMEKTMIFCVDMDHARLVARLLQNEFADLGHDDYALPIISEEGEKAKEWLEAFADSDKKLPVIATTAELLSTGVDVPSCRNIVFVKTLSSPVLFKQIIGRGSRVDQATDKLWFRIIDYTGATRLFDSWDRPPTPPARGPKGPQTASIKGLVVNAKDMGLVVGASVFLQTAPNVVKGPEYTNDQGEFVFSGLPEGRLELTVQATGFRSKRMKVDTKADETVFVSIELREVGEEKGKIKVKGLEVTIADEVVFLIEATGEQLSFEQYKAYTRNKTIQSTPTLKDLKSVWTDPEKRRKFMEDMRDSSIQPEVIAEVMGKTEADAFDLLAHLAFGVIIRTRDERAIAFRNREQRFINQYGLEARKVILELLDKYRVVGIEELADARIFSVQPFRKWGGAVGISRIFGGTDQLQKILKEMQCKLYSEEAA